MILDTDSIDKIHVNMSYEDICTCMEKCKDDACIKGFLYIGASKLYCYTHKIDIQHTNLLYKLDTHPIYNLVKQLDYEWSHTTVATRQHRAKLVHTDYVKFTSSDGNKHTHTKLLVAYKIEDLLSILGYVDIGDGWFAYG